MITYIPRPDTYQMSEQMTYTTLIVVAGVVVGLLIAVKALLWDEWTAAWSIDDAEADIEDMADDLYAGRDQHTDDVRESMQGRWVA